MISSLSTFLENMYWIDIIIIITVVMVYSFLIHIHAKKNLEKNKKYNRELREMRSEIYTEYEKNFFL